jgi:hypothetical protein
MLKCPSLLFQFLHYRLFASKQTEVLRTPSTKAECISISRYVGRCRTSFFSCVMIRNCKHALPLLGCHCISISYLTLSFIFFSCGGREPNASGDSVGYTVELYERWDLSFLIYLQTTVEKHLPPSYVRACMCT